MMEGLFGTLACSWILLIMIFFLWRTSEADARFYRGEASRYFDKYYELRSCVYDAAAEEECTIEPDTGEEEDADDWWRHPQEEEDS